MLVSNLAHTEIKNLKNILLFGTLDIIHDINMETSTVCNRRCSYCPNSIYDRGLEKNKKDMPFWLFKKIIDELSEINFEGRLSPHFFNEPLLDERIFTLIKYAITKLPKARIVLYTNGDFLTPITYNALIEAGVSGFVITSHEGKHNNNLESRGADCGGAHQHLPDGLQPADVPARGDAFRAPQRAGAAGR